jgi:Zn-dependent protease with chaperone function
MVTEAAALVVLAVLLAGPATIALSRADWPSRYPAAALILWQGVGLAGGMALITSELTFAAAGRAGSWLSAVTDTVRSPTTDTGRGALGLTAFAVTVLWLIGVLVLSALRVAAARRRHRDLIDVLAHRSVVAPQPDVYVVAHETATAYSVPGRPRRIVLSQGACDRLGADALRAVVEHERAHLRQHHDIVVQPFVAWQRSFPFLGAATEARRAVETLVEYLADDAAAKRADSGPLTDALSALGASPQDVETRSRRIPHDHAQRARRRHRSMVMTVLAAAVAAAVVAVPPALLIIVS